MSPSKIAMNPLHFSLQPKSVPLVATRYRRIRTQLPVPESTPILAQLARCEPAAMLGQPPIIWDRADAFSVHDPYGNTWIDWTSGVLVANAGHGHAAIKEAAIAEMERGLMFSYCFPTMARARLVGKLLELAPRPLDKVFLLTTGSEATENAIKLARTRAIKRHNPDKRVIVSFHNGFHGRTLGAQLAGGTASAKAWIGDSDKGFVQVPFPDGFRCRDTSFESFVEQLAVQGIQSNQVAGVLMESYQGGGASFAPAHYVAQLREWCTQHDALLILDEVQSGFGRTGRWFAFEHYNVIPDLVCLGKGISGALPLSAVLGKAEILDQYGPGSMTSTFGGHPVCCAGALANLEALESEGLIDRAHRVGDFLETRLREIMSQNSGIIGAVHGKGMVHGVHMVKPGSVEPDAALAFAVVERCFERGVLMFAPVGFGGATIKIAPPLVIDEDALDESLRVFADAVHHVNASCYQVAA